MKTGMNLLLWTTGVTEEHDSLIENIAKWGYDGIEVPIFSFERPSYERLRGRLEELNLKATAVTCTPPEANPISDDASVRDAAVKFLLDAVDCAQIMGAELLCGPWPSPVGELIGRGRTDEEWKRCVEVMRKMADAAEKAGITLAVEYLNRFETYFINTARDTGQLVRDVDHPSFRMMFDTFHANIEEKNIAAALASVKEELAHVHISENDRGVPGTGLIPFAEVFATLKNIGYTGWVTIESFGQSLPEIAKAAAVWRPLAPSDEAVAVDGLKLMQELIA